MSVDIPLMRWCSEYFVRAGGLAYFGDVLGTIDPSSPSMTSRGRLSISIQNFGPR